MSSFQSVARTRYLNQKEWTYVADVEQRYPRLSRCAALVEELRLAEESVLFLAAECFGQLRCSKLVRQLGNVARELATQFPMPEDEWGSELPGRKRLEAVLWALGRTDTLQSQGILAELLQSSRNPIVRADVMEYMAYGRNFNAELVWPFADMKFSIPEILSAIYALEFNQGEHSSEEVELRLEPLLAHEYPLVASYIMTLLSRDPVHRDFVNSLLGHPAEHVRKAAADALRDI